MSNSPDSTDAEHALRLIDHSRAALRQAVRAHRGHLHLWLWGTIWIAMSISVHFRGSGATRFFPFLIAAGIISSIAIGIYQARHIRTPLDKRFFAALGCLVMFALFWPFLFGGIKGPRADIREFAYYSLVAMQIYILAGIWFDNYLLFVGLAVSILILIGLFVFPEIFWLWFAFCCGVPIVLSGFVVRYWWR